MKVSALIQTWQILNESLSSVSRHRRQRILATSYNDGVLLSDCTGISVVNIVFRHETFSLLCSHCSVLEIESRHGGPVRLKQICGAEAHQVYSSLAGPGDMFFPRP